jgi:hypothetical protein
MAGYAQTLGGYGYYKPPTAQRAPGRSLALAASGRQQPADDPFGLVYQHSPGVTAPPAAAPAKPAAAAPYGAGKNALPGGPGSNLAVLGLGGFNGMVPGFSTDALGQLVPAGSTGSGALKPFDINTDPTYQEAVSLAGKSDADATSSALRAKQDVLRGYGDPTLAKAVLGDDTLAQAAGSNPTSTLADLAHQRQTNLHDLTEGLNKDNLAFSGYRISQEGEQAHQYQDALAQAAANVSGTLGSIDSQLGGQLDTNSQARINAELAAYAAHKGDTGGTDITPPPADSGAAPPPGSTLPPPPGDVTSPDDAYATLLALAAQRRKSVGT